MSDGERVVVVGAGLGGISSAISLATEGYEVHVYEKNDHLGGKLNVTEQEGFTFDLGPSILTMPHVFEELFDRAGKDMEDYVEIEEIDLQWRNFFEDGRVIDLYSDPAETVKKNDGLTESDRADLEDFVSYSRGLYEAAKKSYFDEGLDTLWEILKFHGPISALREFDYFHTMHQGVESRIGDPYLVKIIDFFIKYVGSSPYDAPAVLALLPYVQFEFGLWYVRGGMYNLARGLRKLAEELGVRVHLGREVREMETSGGEVVGISLDDGEEVKGDLFVSNMEVIPAYEELLGDRGKTVEDYKRRFEPACSGYVLNLGVDKKFDQLAHHNFFFSRDPEKHFWTVYHERKLPEDPTIYLVATTKTDESQAPAGCENIKILPHIPHLQDDPFDEDEYSGFREKVLDKLERMGLEGLRDHIVTEIEWTPEDIKDNYYSTRGAIYGVLSDRKKNRGFKAPKKSEKYDNLYFVGGSVNPGGGMPMVVLSGQQVRDKIIG